MSNITTTKPISNDQKVNFDTTEVENKSIAHQKFNESQWDSIEITNPDEKPVVEVMKQLGRNNVSKQYLERSFETCGDYYYYVREMVIREGFLNLLEPIEYKSIFKKSKKKKSGGKHKKVSLEEALTGRTIEEAEKYLKSKNSLKQEEMIAINTLKQMTKSFKKDLVGMINCDVLYYINNSGLNAKYLEFRLLTIMKLMENSVTEIEKGENNTMRDYELISSVDRILKELDIVYELDKNSDPQIVIDLKFILQTLKDTLSFTSKKLITEYPKFMFPTRYEDIIPTISIKPYQHQIQLMDLIHNNNKSLSLYRVAIGGGKTTTAGAIASYVQSIKEKEKAKQITTKSTTLLFVCSVEPVRIQVGRNVWIMGIPLGNSTSRGKQGNSVELVPNYNCYENIPRHKRKRKNIKATELALNNITVILSDIPTAHLLLKDAKMKKQKGEKYREYVMFIDEPTVGAEKENHPITNSIPYLIKESEDVCTHIILSSASLPPEDQIPKLLELYRSVHPTGVIKNIDSQESKIGCEIISHSDYTVAPHTDSKTVDDLKNVVKTIDEQPFIGRLYTAPILYQLYESMLNEKLNPSDINEFFKDVSNHSQKKIQLQSLDMLRYMIDNTDDDTVEKVCRPIKKYRILNTVEKDKKKKVKKEKSDDDIWESESESEEEIDTNDIIEDVDYSSITPSQLTTNKSCFFTGGCLITTHRPIETAQEMGKSLLDGFTSLDSMIKKYENKKRIQNATIEKINKMKPPDYVKNPEDYKDKLIQDVKAPEFPFPEWAQINTAEHIKKYSEIPFEIMEKSMIRHMLTVNDINYESLSVPEWVTLLLYAGVGVYIPSCSFLSHQYTTTVLSLAEKGRLAYIISDESINYGVNIPINHVMIDDDFMGTDDKDRLHSINTIFQLAGRAGRVGKSWVAYLHLGKVGIDRIINCVHGKSDNGNRLEAINMEYAVEKMYKDIDKNKIREEELQKERELREEENRKNREREKKVITMEQFNKKNTVTRDKKTKVSDYRSRWRTKTENKSRPWKRDSKMSYHVVSGGRTKGTEKELLREYQRLKHNGSFIPPHIKNIARKNNML